MMISFNGINKYCNAIEHIDIDSKFPHRLFIKYHTCEQITRTGLPINDYSFLLFKGAISPFNQKPLYIFHSVYPSVIGCRTYIESDLDLSQGTFTLALTENSGFLRDISCYIIFCNGSIIKKQQCELEVLDIISTDNNYHFDIKYQLLPNLPTDEINHAIIAYDVTGRSSQLGMKIIPNDSKEQRQTVVIENIHCGAQLTIGYYRDPFFNTCVAKHRIIIERTLPKQ